MKKMLFIINPNAGQKRANRFVLDIVTMFNRAGYTVTVHSTAGPGDAMRIARRFARHMDLVVCCGGDGTFNEVVNGILRSDISVPVGYIPAGTTNDFAASLKIPTRILPAAKAILDGSPRKLDMGQFGTRYFSYVASFGAFTRASYNTPQNIKNALGHTAYVLEGIQELSQIRTIHARFELDGRVVEDDFLFGAVSNATSVGGVLTLDPRQVDLSDGLFEVLLIRAPRDLLELSECIHALQTQRYNCSMITFRSASHIKVTGGRDLVWTLDGERAEWQKNVEIHNLHNAITLMMKG